MSTTPTSKPHITNARILLGLDGFGPVTIEDWRSLGPSVARALIFATDDIDRLTDELEEARAELANERGEGEPPELGWRRNDFDRGVISWTLYLDERLRPLEIPNGVDERWVLWAILTRATGNIEWNVDECEEGMTVMRGEASSLRSAMRAASAATRGAT